MNEPKINENKKMSSEQLKTEKRKFIDEVKKELNVEVLKI